VHYQPGAEDFARDVAALLPDAIARDRVMNAIFDGRTFAQAVTIGYHDDARSLWQKFIASNSDRK
jgi:hypothetical protein